MPRVSVLITPSVQQALLKVARLEMRPPSQQAALFLVKGLIEAGAIDEDAASVVSATKTARNP